MGLLTTIRLARFGELSPLRVGCGHRLQLAKQMFTFLFSGEDLLGAAASGSESYVARIFRRAHCPSDDSTPAWEYDRLWRVLDSFGAPWSRARL